MELRRFKSGISEIRNRPISSLRTSLTVTGISCRACVPANKKPVFEATERYSACPNVHVYDQLPISKPKARGLCIVASGSG